MMLFSRFFLILRFNGIILLLCVVYVWEKLSIYEINMCIKGVFDCIKNLYCIIFVNLIFRF